MLLYVREESADLSSLASEVTDIEEGTLRVPRDGSQRARPWLGVVLGFAGITGLVISSTLYLLFTIWGFGEVLACGTDSTRPWFDPDDFTVYDRPVMCGNGLAWFAVAAPVLGWLLSSTASLMLLLGLHRPGLFVPLGLTIGVVFVAWLTWSQVLLEDLRALETVPM